MKADVRQTLETFFSRFPERSYPKGHILLFAGENPTHIFYLEQGRVRKYAVSYRGEEMIVDLFRDGTYFPMSWAVAGIENHYYYKTEEPTVARLAPASETVQFLSDNPAVMLDLLSRLYTGINSMLGRITHLMSASAKSRVIYELLLECHEFGVQDDDGGCRVVLRETDLAARAGLSRETVSREMRKLKQSGLVTTSRAGMCIHDLAALEQLIGSEL